MTDGIGRIGGGNYGLFYGPQKQGDDVTENQTSQTAAKNHAETQVDPAKVMEFLASNNFFVAPVETAKTGEVDAATQERIAGYMENFEMIYGIIVEEFGEELAPYVMDIAMDYLMGMAA